MIGITDSRIPPMENFCFSSARLWFRGMMRLRQWKLCAPEGGSRPWLLMKTDWESQQCKSVQQCQVKCPEHSSPEAALEINPPLQHTLCTNSFFLGVFLCVCELFGFAWYRQHSSHHFKTTYIWTLRNWCWLGPSGAASVIPWHSASVPTTIKPSPSLFII